MRGHAPACTMCALTYSAIFQDDLAADRTSRLPWSLSVKSPRNFGTGLVIQLYYINSFK